MSSTYQNNMASGKLIEHAIEYQDDYVLIFEYTSGGVTRRRFVSPYKIRPGVLTLEGLCLTRQETRQFKIQAMQKIMLACAHDFVMPVKEMLLVPVEGNSLNGNSKKTQDH